MKDLIKKIKWFHHASKDYMEYKEHKIRYVLGYPKALIKFLWASRNDPYYHH